MAQAKTDGRTGSRSRSRGARSARQLGFEFRTWGGARKRAGRRPNGRSAGVSHLRRPAQSPSHPVHVTLRIAPGFQSLRGSALFRTIRGALAKARERLGVRLIHFSIQRDHLHLIVEADEGALSRGIQGLSIRVAKGINRRLGRRGRVFADRFHARALKTPRETRWAVRYVLLNGKKHEQRGRIPAGFVDSCSSAAWFEGWSRPLELCLGRERMSEPPVVAPRTWLLTIGLRRAGPLDIDDAPRSMS